jgi:hypothetical protein
MQRSDIIRAMTSDQCEFIAQRLAKLLTATFQRSQMVSKGEMTLDQANEQNTEYVERQRAEMTMEEFDEFFSGIGRLNYMANKEMSELGRPVPGNDPQNPN